MSIYVKCEGCGKILNVPDGCEGCTIQCATCDKRMRVPNPAAHTAAEAAQPSAAPAAPAPQAPASEAVPADQADFFRALAEEAARERREADAAKAAKAAAEAELTPLSEGISGGPSAAIEDLEIQTAAGEPGHAAAESPVPPPVAPRPNAPAGESVPDDKEALFKALAEEAAREQREAEAAKAAKASAEAELPPSPEAIARGQSSAAKELRIKTVADKSGYAVANVPEPSMQDTRPRSLRKWIGVAAGLLLLVILIGISINVGLSSSSRSSSSGSKPAPKEKPVSDTPVVSPPSTPAITPPELSAPLKEAAQALADKASVEVEVVETAAEAAVQPMPMLTPAGDVLLDVTNLHIRDKNGADASFQEMRSAIQSAVCESVAAALREKGLTAAQAGESAAGNPGEAHSRLKVFISATPAWAGFSFRGSGTSGPENMPSRPALPPRLGPSPRGSRHTQFTPPRAPAPSSR